MAPRRSYRQSNLPGRFHRRGQNFVHVTYLKIVAATVLMGFPLFVANTSTAAEIWRNIYAVFVTPAPALPAGPADFLRNYRYAEQVRLASKEHEVPAELIHALIEVSSRSNPRAKSNQGAMGLMQIIPATAKLMNVGDPYDPEQNVYAGTSYLKQLLRQFEGNEVKALAAYRYGPQAVKDLPNKGRVSTAMRSFVGEVMKLYESNRAVIKSSSASVEHAAPRLNG